MARLYLFRAKVFEHYLFRKDLPGDANGHATLCTFERADSKWNHRHTVDKDGVSTIVFNQIASRPHQVCIVKVGKSVQKNIEPWPAKFKTLG